MVPVGFSLVPHGQRRGGGPGAAAPAAEGTPWPAQVLMMGLIFAKLWSLFCNQGEKDGAAQRLESEAEGLAPEGDSRGETGF